MALSVKFWGVRGSLPSGPTPAQWKDHLINTLADVQAQGTEKISEVSQRLHSVPLPHVGGYGTATTCVEVRSPHSELIIDGGSGIRNLSDSIVKKARLMSRPFHIFMTHFHWDHIIGLPFFTPHFVPGCEVHYYAVQEDLEPLIRGVFKRPYFPVSFEKLQAKIHFHVLEPRKSYQINDMTITPYQLDHPDPCWGVKVECAGKVYAHCVDTEGTRVTRESLGADLPLYQNVDLMYFDAQYTLPELAEKANWGHSAAQIGLDIAFREGIKQVLFAHHDPGATIQNIEELKKQTRAHYEARQSFADFNKQNLTPVKWDFAHEGLEIEL